jgi:quinoprotein relay system zinc metallohydrolase 1
MIGSAIGEAVGRAAGAGRWLVGGACLGLSYLADSASPPTFGLEAVEVRGGCHAVVGDTGYFNRANGGNISNTGFIVTDDSVVVIDTGSSHRYGRELRKLVDSVSGGLPIERVIITHMHPDHFLGNQAFADTDIWAGPLTTRDIDSLGGQFTLNLYRLAGDWMRGTESLLPNRHLEAADVEIGGHQLSIRLFAGHTGEDAVVLDHTCGVLYAGDLVFNRRAPAVPHADLGVWRESLDRLAALPYLALVPGHGLPVMDDAPIGETAAYLEWLERTVREAFDAGLDVTEVMELPLPERFSGATLAREEFRRSVLTLFPALETSNLPVIAN